MEYSRLSFFICLIITSFLVAPVAGATLQTDFPVIRIYLEKDGSPYIVNSSLSITCFGYVCAGNDCRESTKKQVNKTGFTLFSEVCPSFGCTFYRYGEVGGLNSGSYYSRCDLLVSSPDRNYTLFGYSDRPFTNCSVIASSMLTVLTPEYFTCIGREADTRVQCIHDNTLSDAAAVQSCQDAYSRNIGFCRSNWTHPNLSVPEWRGEGFPPRPATEICDMHFSLPPDGNVPAIVTSFGQNYTAATNVFPMSAPAEEKVTANSNGFTGSLWCSILSILGGRCE